MTALRLRFNAVVVVGAASFRLVIAALVAIMRTCVVGVAVSSSSFVVGGDAICAGVVVSVVLVVAGVRAVLRWLVVASM